MTISLEEFAAAKSSHRWRCATCSNPLRETLEKGRASGLSYGVMAEWLRVHHPEHAVKATAIRQHFANGHAEPA